MLDANRAASFLLRLGLIGHNAIIDGALTFRGERRRNHNLRVEGPGAGFLVKQSLEVPGAPTETLPFEARFLGFCRDQPAMARVSRCIPRLTHDNPRDGVLVVELIPRSVALWSYLELHGDRALATSAGRALGGALGLIHRSFTELGPETSSQLTWMTRGLPWAMRLHRPSPGMLPELSQGHRELLKVLQTEPGFWDRLEQMCERWKPTTVIHGDIKLENVLVRIGEEQGDEAVELWIADWEMVQYGDPAWDLAGALHDFLVFWVSSMPLSSDMTGEEMAARARVPLAFLRQATRALWYSYRAQSGLAHASASEFLSRAISFSAGRLVQSAFERLVRADRLAGEAVLLLQISANLLADPDRAQLHLYGIPLEY